MDISKTVTEEQKISGLNKLFFAPELFHKSEELTSKVDIWSIGAILYFLVCGKILDKKESSGDKASVFDFSEPEWNKRITQPCVRDFIQSCI